MTTEIMTKSLLSRNNKRWGMSGHWQNKSYSPVLKKKKIKRSFSVTDKVGFWRSSEEVDSDCTSQRSSELMERDSFLDLLCRVQDNRYENQRYTLKASFTDTKSEGSNPDEDMIPVNGTLPNGGRVTTPDINVPNIEISPTTEHVVANGSIPNGHAQSPCNGESDDLGRESLSPPPLPMSTVTPSRKSMEALRKVIAQEGPYPLLIEPPDGGFWIQNGEYESARGEDGIWRAPEISTEHYNLDSNKNAFVYGRHLVGENHQNYIARDSKVGHVILSMRYEEDYQGTSLWMILRTQRETMCRHIPLSQIPEYINEPEDLMRYMYAIKHEDDLNIDKAIRVLYPKAPELLQKFDEHMVAKTHKFGIIYQQYGQTSEEELFGNVDHPPALDEFLELLGDKVTLKGFKGYRGGLDVTNNQTGECSIYTEYKDRQIMFHCSTMLPHDPADSQSVQRKRHIGNDIVVIVFQDKNTPFSPMTVRSHFVHSYIVVQVEHPNTDHTVYKVAVAAKDQVPDFGPPLPDPAIFQKGPEFRDWLLTKILNAEYNSHLAPDFMKLAKRTRCQLFLHMVDEITQTMEDVDYYSFRHLSLGIEPGLGGNSPRRRRRKTLGGIFAKKENLPISFLPAFGAKRKSIGGSPKSYRKLLAHSTSEGVVQGIVHVASSPNLDVRYRESPASIHSLTLANTQIDHLTTSSEREGGSSNKAKIKRRFTFRKEKKTKRRASETPSTGSSFELYRGKRTLVDAATSPRVKGGSIKSQNSSEDSSIASSLNWSIPSDLPGAVDAPHRQGRGSLDSLAIAQLRARCRSTPTIHERSESGSGVSVSDLRILEDGPLTADVAVQVNSYDGIFQFPSPSSSVSPTSPRSAAKPDEIDLHSQSLPGTPSKLRNSRATNAIRKLPTNKEIRERYDRRSSSPGNSQLAYANLSRTMQDGDQFQRSSSSQGHDYDGDRTDERYVFRAEPTDGVSADVEEVYDTLLQTLQELSVETTRLRQHNVMLCTENAKLASQNRRLKRRHAEDKQQLTEAQDEIQTLRLKLRLYQPDFPEIDD